MLCLQPNKVLMCPGLPGWHSKFSGMPWMLCPVLPKPQHPPGVYGSFSIAPATTSSTQTWVHPTAEAAGCIGTAVLGHRPLPSSGKVSGTAEQDTPAAIPFPAQGLLLALSWLWLSSSKLFISPPATVLPREPQKHSAPFTLQLQWRIFGFVHHQGSLKEPLEWKGHG